MPQEKPQTVPPTLHGLARLLGTVVKNWRLDIPQKFGSGYCTGFIFNDHIRMLILNYELHEDLVIDNPEVSTTATILFKFQNVFPKAHNAAEPPNATPSVLIATNGIHTDAAIPVHSQTSVINIEVDARYLNGLFDTAERSPILQSLLQNTQPLLFEQLIYPALQKIVDEIITEPVGETFKLFFLRIKAEELICKLFMALQKRDEQHIYPLNTHDIQTLYRIKAQILKHLETPPVISALATDANMSPTKLKRLFKQIFGNSIFSYYQEFRMKEAAILLKDKRLSVADVGNRLGFTNLSHFTRVFKQHLGIKPKQHQKNQHKDGVRGKTA